MSAPVSPPSPGQTVAATGNSSLPSAQRILVVRLSAMGDIIHALPAITALRVAKPSLQIGWLVEERWAELLCARSSEYFAPRSPEKPLADWVHVANFKRWRKALLSPATWHEIGSLRSHVRALKYEVALDLQGAIRSALAAQSSGAGVRVGSSRPREVPAAMFYTQQVDSRGVHVVEQALSVVSAVAERPLHYMEPLFPLDPTAEEWAKQACANFADKPLAILNPGAGWGAKCWPAESFAVVAVSLKERGFAVVLNHGPGEEALAAAVRDASGGIAVPLKCTVGELIALTRRASLFIGGDTGPMHLAAALRVPVVALFGPTRPERNGPYGTPSVVLRSPASVSNSSHTNRADEGLLSIPPQAVMDAAEQLLGGLGG